MQRTSFLQLRYGAGEVIEPFLARVYGERNLKKIYWVSPWITHLNFKTANTKELIKQFQLRRVNLVVITREPDSGSPHEEFVRDIREMPTASIFYMPTLHAKFYIAETRERRYALLGSANMYKMVSPIIRVGSCD